MAKKLLQALKVQRKTREVKVGEDGQTRVDHLRSTREKPLKVHLWERGSLKQISCYRPRKGKIKARIVIRPIPYITEPRPISKQWHSNESG